MGKYSRHDTRRTRKQTSLSDTWNEKKLNDYDGRIQKKKEFERILGINDRSIKKIRTRIKKSKINSNDK